MTYSHSTFIAFDGVEQSIAEHALDYGIPAHRIVQRLVAGWPVQDAITRPVTVLQREKRKPHTGKRQDEDAEIYRPSLRAQKRAGSHIPRHTHDGKTMTVPEWSKLTGIKHATLNYRLRRGMSFADAITSTVDSGNRFVRSAKDGSE